MKGRRWGWADEDRVIRGGSWNNDARNARCAYRNRNDPEDYNTNIGFRVVLSHNFSGLTGNVRYRPSSMEGQMATEVSQEELAQSIPGWPDRRSAK